MGSRLPPEFLQPLLPACFRVSAFTSGGAAASGCMACKRSRKSEQRVALAPRKTPPGSEQSAALADPPLGPHIILFGIGRATGGTFSPTRNLSPVTQMSKPTAFLARLAIDDSLVTVRRPSKRLRHPVKRLVIFRRKIRQLAQLPHTFDRWCCENGDPGVQRLSFQWGPPKIPL